MKPVKSNILITIWFVITFFLSSSIAGQKCDTTIRKDHVAEDLSRAFACIDDRLNKLENIVTKTGAVTEDKASAYDIGGLKLSVSGASKKRGSGGIGGGGRIYISLQMQNKTTEPMLVAVDSRQPAALVEYASGQPKGRHHYEYISEATTDATNERYYTPIPINSSITPSFIFNSDETTESAFTLNLSLLRLKNGTVERLPASFKVIAE